MDGEVEEQMDEQLVVKGCMGGWVDGLMGRENGCLDRYIGGLMGRCVNGGAKMEGIGDGAVGSTIKRANLEFLILTIPTVIHRCPHL